MKEIKLTQEKIALVDDEDYESLNQFKWCANRNRGTYYAMRRCNRKTVLMHRVILDATQGIQCDHVNSNGLDNRKENLRLCTNQENCFNRKNPRRDNKLGIKGVDWDKKRKKFRAQIKINGKLICLGHFNVMGDADAAYRFAEKKYFGEFARNNK